MTLERVMFNFPGPETGPTRSANMGQSRNSRWEKIGEAPKHRRNKGVVGPVETPEKHQLAENRWENDPATSTKMESNSKIVI